MHFISQYNVSYDISEDSDKAVYIGSLSSLMLIFYTQPHDSGWVLWFHVGRPCVCPSVLFSVPDDNLSKNWWIFTKLGMRIDMIWFGIC